jgi:hypothetical protein
MKTLAHLERQHHNPDILSHIINSMGMMTLVLHKLGEHLVSLIATLNHLLPQVASLIPQLDKVVVALTANRQALADNNQKLAEMQANIQQARLPWGKLIVLGTFSACFALAVFLNADHLFFLRIPTAEDTRIEKLCKEVDALRAENDTLRKMNKGFYDQNVSLDYELFKNTAQQKTALQEQYDLGYAQAMADINKRLRGE